MAKLTPNPTPASQALDDWIGPKPGLRAHELARAMCVTVQMVRYWRSGMHKPRPGHRTLIEAATHGAVRADGWGVDPAPAVEAPLKPPTATTTAPPTPPDVDPSGHATGTPVPVEVAVTFDEHDDRHLSVALLWLVDAFVEHERYGDLASLHLTLAKLRTVGLPLRLDEMREAVYQPGTSGRVAVSYGAAVQAVDPRKKWVEID